ncbi:lamin tail domain-containing protein [Solwaraspora sp. WMMD406]|uniref:lamin tail domain-containing protein n=1 Tax=Solwaraspora sp. WMMD406 TaxID=3016095 RepID=UPI002415A696|nr:lamin tail domain-containing protein [Solwaraspora sp. WMMD406]MDG4768233.1 lamin tail domain-containing protein [Solwaraspora sp. WMMD406]
MRRTVRILLSGVMGLATSIALAVPGTAAGAAAPDTAASDAALAGADSAAPDLRVHSVQYDPKGLDDGSGALLNREWVQLINRGKEPLRLRGYTVHNSAGKTYRFGDVTIAGKGGRLWLRSGSGDDTARSYYWNNDAFVWGADGDKVFLRDRKGRTVHTCSWTFVKDRDWVRCPVSP